MRFCHCSWITNEECGNTKYFSLFLGQYLYFIFILSLFYLYFIFILSLSLSLFLYFSFSIWDNFWVKWITINQYSIFIVFHCHDHELFTIMISILLNFQFNGFCNLSIRYLNNIWCNFQLKMFYDIFVVLLPFCHFHEYLMRKVPILKISFYSWVIRLFWVSGTILRQNVPILSNLFFLLFIIMTSIVLRFHFIRLFPKWYILSNRFQAKFIKLGPLLKFEQNNSYPLHYYASPVNKWKSFLPWS